MIEINTGHQRQPTRLGQAERVPEGHMTVARRFIARSPSRARTRDKGKVASRSDFEGSNLVARKLEDMVEFHRASGKIAGQPRAYNDPVCLCVSVKR